METNRLRPRKTADERAEPSERSGGTILVVEPDRSRDLGVGIVGCEGRRGRELLLRGDAAGPLCRRRNPCTSSRCTAVVGRPNVGRNGGSPRGEFGWRRSAARTAEGVSGCTRFACLHAAGRLRRRAASRARARD